MAVQVSRAGVQGGYEVSSSEEGGTGRGRFPKIEQDSGGCPACFILWGRVVFNNTNCLFEMQKW